MNTSTLLVGLLSCSLLGCTADGFEEGSGFRKVYIDQDFDNNQYALVHQAVESWSIAMEDYVDITYSNDWHVEPNKIIISFGTQAGLTDEFSPEGGLLGLTTDTNSSSVILVAADENPTTFEQCAKHELGHAFGLHHVGPGHIMCKDAGCATLNITCGDIQQFCSVWGCDAASMKICQ